MNGRNSRDVPELRSSTEGTKETQRLLRLFMPWSACGESQGAYKGSKNTRRTKALQSLRRASVSGTAIQAGRGLADGSHRRVSAEMGCQGWRPSKRATAPRGAKAAAKVLITTKGKAEPRDWIQELDQIAANEVDRAVIERQRRQWPINLMGMNNRQTPLMKVDPKSIDPESIRAVLDIERVLIVDEQPSTPGALQGEDYQLEYYEDGYPKLPACLDRRIKLAEAA